MIGLFPYLAAGLLLLALFVHLVLRRGTEDHDFDVSSEVEGQETRLESRGILPQLTARLFRSVDWEFVTKQGSARLESLFLQQRTALALAWVRRVRAYVEELMRTHRASARMNSQINLREELEISFEYFLFQMLCQCIALMIRFRGPIELGRLIGHAEELSRRLDNCMARLTLKESAAGNHKADERAIVGLTKR
jgi:hypothetical protein